MVPRAARPVFFGFPLHLAFGRSLIHLFVSSIARWLTRFANLFPSPSLALARSGSVFCSLHRLRTPSVARSLARCLAWPAPFLFSPPHVLQRTGSYACNLKPRVDSPSAQPASQPPRIKSIADTHARAPARPLVCLLASLTAARPKNERDRQLAASFFPSSADQPRRPGCEHPHRRVSPFAASLARPPVPSSVGRITDGRPVYTPHSLASLACTKGLPKGAQCCAPHQTLPVHTSTCPSTDPTLPCLSRTRMRLAVAPPYAGFFASGLRHH